MPDPFVLGVIMFSLQVVFALMMALISRSLNAMGTAFRDMAKDLRKLNDAVLGEYAKRSEVSAAIEATHKRIHDLRADTHDLIGKLNNRLETLSLDLERQGVQIRRRAEGTN